MPLWREKPSRQREPVQRPWVGAYLEKSLLAGSVAIGRPVRGRHRVNVGGWIRYCLVDYLRFLGFVSLSWWVIEEAIRGFQAKVWHDSVTTWVLKYSSRWLCWVSRCIRVGANRLCVTEIQGHQANDALCHIHGTYIGIQLQLQWEVSTAFIQPSPGLFQWLRIYPAQHTGQLTGTNHQKSDTLATLSQGEMQIDGQMPQLSCLPGFPVPL